MYSSVITISRQFGSGGRFVGKMLAERLGIPFYDNELISIAAKESGYAESLFEKADQNTSNSLLYSLSMFGTTAGVYGLPLSDKVYIIQSDVIRKIASQGACVIIGRCADYVLKDNPNLINIFVHSDIKSKIQRAVKYYNIEEKDAESQITKIDKKRSTYYSYYTGQKWGEAENYDLSIHCDAIGVEKCVDIIEEFVKEKENKLKA